MANITIDGKPYTVKDGITIIEAIDQAKIALPRYCYHPGLSIAGNCRICQVEVGKIPRTVIACNTRVAEGMEIMTQSSKAKESQQVVLEFLLANHPLDCPVCDQAGECKLQDYYMEYGLYDSKLDDQKVKKSKKAFSIGPTVDLDQDRCILCTRCVRFSNEITKTDDFGVFNRGDHSELDLYPGKQLNNKYSGNVVDICPVGALTDHDFRFKMRVWYLGSQDSVCTGCARGCNIQVHFEKSRPYKSDEGRVMRLKPRENADVNKWWICDEGRYGYKFVDQNRILEVTKGGQAQDWKTAISDVSHISKKANPEKWGLLASAQYTNEELYLIQKLFMGQLSWKNVAFYTKQSEGFEDDFLMKKDKNPNSSGATKLLKLSEQQKDISALVEKAKRGELDGLLVFHHDLGKLFGEETLKLIRQKTKMLIYEGWNHNSTSRAADWVLPSATFAEKDGTFTNFEGRVQRIRKAIEPAGQSLPSWQLWRDLGNAMGAKLSYDRAEFVFDDIAKEVPAFKEMSYKKLGSAGQVWSAS